MKPSYDVKIDMNGWLFVRNSNGKLKAKYCPYTAFEGYCGDHCSLFSVYPEVDDIGNEHIVVSLCHGMWLVEKDRFIDERDL